MYELLLGDEVVARVGPDGWVKVEGHESMHNAMNVLYPVKSRTPEQLAKLVAGASGGCVFRPYAPAELPQAEPAKKGAELPHPPKIPT